jgi:hypothetical protein
VFFTILAIGCAGLALVAFVGSFVDGSAILSVGAFVSGGLAVATGGAAKLLFLGDGPSS